MGVAGPFEVTVALPGTAGATLGSFAEGWAEPGQGLWDLSRCEDEHILHRWELDDIEAAVVALDLGDRLEQSFGTTHRRHLARLGEFEGRFDPRFNW